MVQQLWNPFWDGWTHARNGQLYGFIGTYWYYMFGPWHITCYEHASSWSGNSSGIRYKMPLVIHGCGCKFKATPNMEFWSSSTSDQLWILNLPLQDNSLPISFLLSVVNPIMNLLFRDGLYRSLGMIGPDRDGLWHWVYHVYHLVFFFTSCLHSLSIPSQEHEEELGPREQRRTTGEGREPEDLEIWMNKNDDEPWFLGVQFFGGTQFWPLLTQSHVFLGLKHLKKTLDLFVTLCMASSFTGLS